MLTRYIEEVKRSKDSIISLGLNPSEYKYLIVITIEEFKSLLLYQDILNLHNNHDLSKINQLEYGEILFMSIANISKMSIIPYK